MKIKYKRKVYIISFVVEIYSPKANHSFSTKEKYNSDKIEEDYEKKKIKTK